MFNLLDKFRFTADPSGAPVSLSPVNDGLKKTWNLQDDGVSYRVTMDTELVFRGADYTYFKDILDAGTPCSVEIEIEQFCSGAWESFFSGKITPTEGKYDLDKCEAAFKILPNDVYECAKNEFAKEQNWLLFGSRKNLESLYGTIETTVCSYDGLVVIPNVQLLFLRDCFSGAGPHDVQFDPDPDPTTAWTPVAQSQIFTGNTVGVDTVSIDTTWKREAVTQVGAPPGFGWINIGGNDWVRPVSVISSVQAQTELTYTYDATMADPDTVSGGRLLADMLEDAITETGCDIDEVRSNFLNINPDGTAPTNAAYDYAQDVEGVFQSVLLFQKSDIVNPDASNDATRLPLTLNDFLTALRDSLNVYWSIVDVSGDTVLRIEHLSYFEGSAGLDLTTLDGGKYIRGLNRFETEGDIPSFERFAYQEAYNGPFLPARISYNCPTGAEVDKQLSQMNADFGGLYDNPNAGLIGFVFVCAYPISGNDYLLDTLDGIANGAMQWKRLINNLWVYGRYSELAASTAGGTFTVQTIKKRKAQPPIKIPFCCDAFEPSETVETGLGLGMVKTAEHDTKPGLLTLNLMHE
jgi:hypothetical protein